MARVGILGGSFNPPHVGHVALARCARDQLGLDRVLLIPAREPPHKAIADDPGGDVRLTLCERAVDGEPGLEVSRLELDRAGPSFTVDTLSELHELAPDDELIFIAGGDVARSLPAWRDPARILELARLAVAEREGQGREAVLEALAPLGRTDRVDFLDLEPVTASSTAVRSRVASGADIDGLVAPAVAEEIAARGLYRR